MTIPRVTMNQLVSWTIVAIGVFLAGYVCGYVTGADGVTVASVECAQEWRKTITTLDQCIHSLQDQTIAAEKLTRNCSTIAAKVSECRQW